MITVIRLLPATNRITGAGKEVANDVIWLASTGGDEPIVLFNTLFAHSWSLDKGILRSHGQVLSHSHSDCHSCCHVLPQSAAQSYSSIKAIEADLQLLLPRNKHLPRQKAVRL